MMAPLLTPAPPNSPGPISQVLPSVKCSNCNYPVPLSQLGDHICTKPPPLPVPSFSPAAAVSLLPQRLQARVPSHFTPSHSSPANDSRLSSPSRVPRALEPQQQHLSDVDRLNINSASPVLYQQKSSPLVRFDPSRNAATSPAPRPMASSGPPPPTKDLRSRPPVTSDVRARGASNAGSVSGPSSTIARPSFSSTRETPSPANVFPPPRQGSLAPYLAEAEIDTKIGGEAGMAGVGRRGFAAAARAAMLVGPQHGAPAFHPRDSRRPNAPGLLDIQVPTRCKSSVLSFLCVNNPSQFAAIETPPLSAGSGNSSHSPGISPYPQSPGPPSPPTRHTSQPRDKALMIEPPSSPTSIRIPFSENFRNQVPGVIVPNNPTSLLLNTNTSNTTAPSTVVPLRTNVRQSAASTSSSSAYSHRSSTSTTLLRQDQEVRTRPRSPSSDSECGLAYADSTDNDEEDRKEDLKSTKTKASPPPPLPLTSSILRSGSIATTNHVRFPSTSEYSDRSAIRIPAPKTGYNRGASVSSTTSSSAGADDARSAKSNSALIAHALGLSRTPTSEYARLGGPGSMMGGRVGRSISGSSSSGGSAYSRGSSRSPMTGGVKSGKMEEDVFSAVIPPTDEPLRNSKSTGMQKSFAAESEDDFGSKLASAKGSIAPSPMAHRSNTVQCPSTTDKPKLVARARTSTLKQTETVKEKKEKIRKLRVCVKCDKKIEDGRWIQVDGGGVLCEHCWKNMYLPKVGFSAFIFRDYANSASLQCRRCNLPIEKQAVSSKDGQLKGKYHRECFNCFECSVRFSSTFGLLVVCSDNSQKPFPDKSFYVFDGKPLCAYHYHEANESLCAAARCGQPIEGPCAVSHTGDRYHPEHMTCEHPGPTPCLVKLEEYWEVDGRMLCERHAKASDDDDANLEEWVQSSKAMKRVTRFIDLAGGGGGISESDGNGMR